MISGAMPLAVNYLEILVVGGGVIGWIIWLISILVVALAINYFMAIRRTNILPEEAKLQIVELFEAKQYREAIDLTEMQPDFLSYIVHEALTEAPAWVPGDGACDGRSG